MARPKGFTLVELMVVIAIIAVLVVLLAPTIIDSICNSHKRGVLATISFCSSAIDRYRSAAAIGQPSAQELNDCIDRALKEIRRIRKSPWGDKPDVKTAILDGWTEFKEKYETLREERPGDGLADIPDDPYDPAENPDQPGD